MKIALLSHYFWPEISAPSARLKEMADFWAGWGHDVTVVTNFPNHPTGIVHEGYRRKSFLEERVNRLRVLRCRTFATPNSGFAKRTLGHLTFAYMSACQPLSLLRNTDVIVVSSPTLFSAAGAWWLSRKIGCPYVIEVRDLWPAIFVELGVIKNPMLIRPLEALELFLYRQSRHVVTLTDGFADDIERRGIARQKLEVIPNGVDLRWVTPGARSDSVANAYSVAGKFVVLYIGAHGISQALHSVLRAAERLKDEKEIHFLFVGEGADKDGLIRQAQASNLANVSFHPGVPRDRVPDLYRLADVCLVPLRNIPLFRTFIPSKMFEIMAAGRPIVASVEGEAARILARSEAATVVPPEDSQAIADAVLRVKGAGAAELAEMGRRGREFVERHYNRESLAARYLDLLQKVVSPS